MVSTNKIGSSATRTGRTDTILRSAVLNIPPVLRRFERFIKDMAQKFSRHLSKDRTNELVDAVIKEYRDA